MSSYDISFCGTQCERKDCRRNLKYNKPDFLQYYSMSMFDEDAKSEQHEECEYFYELPERR